MRRLVMGMVAAVLAGTLCVSGQELAFDFTADTTEYVPQSTFLYVFPDPEALPVFVINYGPHYFACVKQDTSAFDIFSCGGKIGTFAITPILKKFSLGRVVLSQKFFDTDDGWEALYSITSGFSVIDDNGSELLTFSDATFRNDPFLGYDGKNTYVCLRSLPFPVEKFKAWRFRTNIASASAPRSLAKSASSGPLPMMTFGATGEYRVSLQPAGGGKTSMQLFDMLGRAIFTKTIDDITRPVSFTVPENSVPSTPFIVKFKDANGSTLRKEIPVR